MEKELWERETEEIDRERVRERKRERERERSHSLRGGRERSGKKIGRE